MKKDHSFEVIKIHDSISAHEGQYPQRVERALAKAFLLEGVFMRNGVRWVPKATHLGLGVYKLYAELF